jgi:hypothetical protein
LTGLNLDGQLRVRAKLNPLSGVLLRALPSSPLVQVIDEELVWIMLDRLGIEHPEAAGIKKCRSCSADMKGGTAKGQLRVTTLCATLKT